VNSSQKLHLLTSCQYVDKLLAEIESVLAASGSRSPFPKYRPDISPVQAKVTQDYIARIRAQMVCALQNYGIELPGPPLGAIHSIRVTLGCASIAFDECRPRNMRGYGELPEAAVPELNGFIEEMKSLIGRLDGYLAQGLGQDLQARLQTLEAAGRQVNLASKLARVIDAHGLVEFRPALSCIVERLESNRFEVEFFGRVSSGKSSLLNRILERDVLPVGVTPVTAVPTRIVYGPAERATAWFADHRPEEFEIARLADFVTEQLNPANWKHVTRVVIELATARLGDGIVLVDTPGLGSLASAGAAETWAYLPRCDLAVVLIDAGSTLTPDDLATLGALYDAAIPALVLLSKSDLLSADDQHRLCQYVADHITSQLDVNLPVCPVSARPEHSGPLERWFQREILPLYDRHVELAQASLQRKIGALRVAVEAALRSRLSPPDVPAGGPAELRLLEADLRRATARFGDVRAQCLGIADQIRESGEEALARAVAAVTGVSRPPGPAAADLGAMLASAVEQLAAAQAVPIASLLNELALSSAQVLARTAAGLVLDDAPEPGELTEILQDMPRLELGTLDIRIRRPRFARSMRLDGTLRAQAGGRILEAFSSHGGQLSGWIRQTLTSLQARFESYAGVYRAQLDRLTQPPQRSLEDQETVRQDLAAIAELPPANP
jgi:GTP-binding protein EngB required for normal cell division